MAFKNILATVATALGLVGSPAPSQNGTLASCPNRPSGTATSQTLLFPVAPVHNAELAATLIGR
jgi:hypothetical protein